MKLMNNEKKRFFEELMERNYKPLDSILPETTVSIAGCGGLGSNVAAALTRAGIGKLIIADFDIVVMSNLNRQFFFVENLNKPKVDALEKNLKMINPFIEIVKHNIKITPDNAFEILQSQIIVEAFDQVSEKTMLLNTFLEKNDKSKYLVTASGMGGINSSNLIMTKLFGDNVFLCGDFINDSSQGLMSPRVNIAAAHEANMVLKIIANNLTP